jgi:hypothetical protein
VKKALFGEIALRRWLEGEVSAKASSACLLKNAFGAFFAALRSAELRGCITE